jgi:uncharacterized protein DUF6851/vanadium-dependent haloperoxidase-like protein
MGVRISRRLFLHGVGVGGLALAGPAIGNARPLLRRLDRRPPDESVVLRWNDAVLEAVRRSSLGPPMVSRALAIVHTCAFDAWAAYDRQAVGTRDAVARRPPRERSLANKSEAISYAAYRAAVDLFPASRAAVFDPLMESLGYDPTETSVDATRAAGVGNLAAAAVLAFRHRDGANQLGDEPGGTPGVPYSDYTGFVPANAPMDLRVPFDPTSVHDPNAWQPLRYVNAAGAVVTPAFVGAQWQRVTPFALGSSGELRPPTGPARHPSAGYTAQAEELLAVGAALTDEQKTIAEYWADGPSSELPPGHWNLFAQLVARRDRRGGRGEELDRDVKLFFALTNAIFDAGVCAWDNKCVFASVRPITAIRFLFAGRQVRAWGGPGLGTRTIRGDEWFPYQPTTFPTPPFPEYSSGHSNFSAAGAEILRLITGSDRFGASVVLAAGSSRVEPGITPANAVTLSWRTFSDAADQAGISRRYGGIHFAQGDLDARATGRLAARRAWAKVQALLGGSRRGGA